MKKNTKKELLRKEELRLIEAINKFPDGSIEQLNAVSTMSKFNEVARNEADAKSKKWIEIGKTVLQVGMYGFLIYAGMAFETKANFGGIAKGVLNRLKI